MQTQAATHQTPRCAAHGHALAARFQLHAIAQLGIESATDVQSRHRALPLHFVIQTTARCQHQFVRFVVHFQAGIGLYVVIATRAFHRQIHHIHRRVTKFHGVAMYVYFHRRGHVRRGAHIKAQLLHIDRILEFQTLGIACQLDVEFFRVTRHMAFGRKQATQAKTKLVQARCMHIHIQFVPCLTDAAIGFDAVAIQQHIQIGAAQMLLLKNHIAIAY